MIAVAGSWLAWIARVSEPVLLACSDPHLEGSPARRDSDKGNGRRIPWMRRPLLRPRLVGSAAPERADLDRGDYPVVPEAAGVVGLALDDHFR